MKSRFLGSAFRARSGKRLDGGGLLGVKHATVLSVGNFPLDPDQLVVKKAGQFTPRRKVLTPHRHDYACDLCLHFPYVLLHFWTKPGIRPSVRGHLHHLLPYPDEFSFSQPSVS